MTYEEARVAQVRAMYEGTFLKLKTLGDGRYELVPAPRAPEKLVRLPVRLRVIPGGKEKP